MYSRDSKNVELHWVASFGLCNRETQDFLVCVMSDTDVLDGPDAYIQIMSGFSGRFKVFEWCF